MLIHGFIDIMILLFTVTETARYCLLPALCRKSPNVLGINDINFCYSFDAETNLPQRILSNLSLLSKTVLRLE